jgi:alkylation response protein AidB-like acyl-CoA dehydrogenase
MGLAPEFPTTATGYRSVLSAVIERTVGPQAAEIDCSGTFPWDKAVAAEAAAEVADGVLRLCGGAALREGLGVERLLRDALAARAMAPTTDALYDFVGRTCLGLPLFDAADK